MPRSPTVATQPPGTTPQVPLTPVPSAIWNGAMDDIYQIFNTLQPIEYGGTFAATAVGGADNLSTSASIASSGTTDLGNVTGVNVSITGTTTITSLGSAQIGAKRWVTFTGILTLTHNATSLILPGGVNITTAAGDTALFESLGSGNWRCTDYQRASGAPVAFGYATTATAAGTTTLTASSARTQYFTGTTTQTVVLPVVSTLSLGDTFRIVNNSTGSVTVQSSGANTITVVGPGLQCTLTCILTSGTTAASWDFKFGGTMTLGTPQASTSGTSIQFLGVPPGTRRVTINFSGVSTNGASALLIQIGPAAGIENTGYSGSGADVVGAAGNTTGIGFVVGTATNAANLVNGSIFLTLLDPSTNTWCASGTLGLSNTGQIYLTGGSKSIAAALDRLLVTTVAGVNTFDAGKINVLYE